MVFAGNRALLAQTFRDFEFVTLNDASPDGSIERLREWAARDERIRLLEVEKNLGPALSSQRVASEASASIVARMGADDISYPDRLERRVALLCQHPLVGVVESLCEIIDSRNKKLRPPEIWRLTKRSASLPFPHGVVMYRRDVFDQAGGYRKEYEYWEDQDLIFRMAAISKVMVIPEALYRHRQWTSNTRLVSDQRRLEQATDLAYRAASRTEQSSGYEYLLAPRGDREKLDPRVFISLGSMALWAGRRPHVFRALVRRGNLGFDMRGSSAIVWSAWAWVSPASLRAFLQLWGKLRNLLARMLSRTIAQ